MYLKLLNPPTELPVTLGTVKQHLRVDGTEEDAYITLLIKSAVNQVQNFTNRQLMRAIYQLGLDSLTDTILIPRPPFAAITTITGKDGSGPVSILEETRDFTVNDSEYATISGVADSYWFDGPYSDVKIVFEAGYASVELIPEDIINAILLIVHDRYENRGDNTDRFPKASQALLYNYRIHNV